MTFDEWFVSRFGKEPDDLVELRKWTHDYSIGLLAWHAALRKDEKKK